jgi:hypothetical protein
LRVATPAVPSFHRTDQPILLTGSTAACPPSWGRRSEILPDFGHYTAGGFPVHLRVYLGYSQLAVSQDRLTRLQTVAFANLSPAQVTQLVGRPERQICLFAGAANGSPVTGDIVGLSWRRFPLLASCPPPLLLADVRRPQGSLPCFPPRLRPLRLRPPRGKKMAVDAQGQEGLSSAWDFGPRKTIRSRSELSSSLRCSVL